MARIQISNDPSGRITVSFPYDPVFVSKVKTIEGRRWNSAETNWSFPNAPYPPHRWGREREGVKKLESRLPPKYKKGWDDEVGESRCIRNSSSIPPFFMSISELRTSSDVNELSASLIKKGLSLR
ncbi:MAG: hypothetical protein ABSB22_07985 [Thermodesulfobacteriota bacterium]|jgi:hypothetical protein